MGAGNPVSHGRGPFLEMSMSDCQHLVDLLLPHLLGKLGDTDQIKLHCHMRTCPACRRRHRQIRQMIKPQEHAYCPHCEGLLATTEAEILGAAGLPGSTEYTVMHTTV